MQKAYLDTLAHKPEAFTNRLVFATAPFPTPAHRLITAFCCSIAEALREAQLSMIKGTIFIEEDQLISLTDSKLLPPELNVEGRQDFSHPYY